MTTISVIARAARIRLMIFDIDGVLTDGRLYFGATGEALKAFHCHDGQGLKLLALANIQIAWITSRSSPSIAARAVELGVQLVYQGVENKLTALNDVLSRTGITAEYIGYMGDDWPDLAIMSAVGFAAAPANAHPEVIACAHWVTQAPGGRGAAREVCDAILRAQQRYDALLTQAAKS